MNVKKTNNASFKGLCIAKYNLPCGKATRELAIYQLEPRDISLVQKLLKKTQMLVPKNLKEDKVPRETRANLLFVSLQRAFYSLKMNERYLFENDQCAKLITVSNSKVCGALVGNMPKVVRNCSKIVRSWTGRANETELNWIATTPTSASNPERGIGTALTAEFFNWIKDSKSSNLIRVKSAVFSEGFYERLGFKATRPKVIQCETNNTPRELASLIAGEHYAPESTTAVYSMQIKRDAALKRFQEIASQYNRTDGNNTSIDLSTVIKL